MKSLILVAWVGLCGAPLFGRVGETEEQLIERFGAPESRSKHQVFEQGRTYDLGPSLSFTEGDWRIGCDLVDGRCVRILYTKVGAWTEEHIQTVLNASTQGGTWTETSKSGAKAMVRDWKRSDGGIAQWVGVRMTVTVPAYFRAKSIAEAKGKAAAAKPAKI